MPHADHTEMLRDLLAAPDLLQHYDFYPDAFFFGIALRRSSPRYPALKVLFEKRWRESYPGVEPSAYQIAKLHGNRR
jgi:hypothetical protein